MCDPYFARPFKRIICVKNIFAMDYGAPVRVSPFIKFCRWSALILGVSWGIHRHNVLKRKEDEHKAYIEKMKPVWEERKRIDKLKSERAELLNLAEATGTKIPADFDQRYPK